MRFVLSSFCIHTDFPFSFQLIVGGPVGFSEECTGLEDALAPFVLFSLPEGVCYFIQSDYSFQTVFNRTIQPGEVYLLYSRSPKAYRDAEA